MMKEDEPESADRGRNPGEHGEIGADADKKDVSERWMRKKLDLCLSEFKKLKDAEREKTNLLAQKDREIERLMGFATSAAQAKSEFVARMNHELRTPLNAIIGLADLAVKTDLSPKQADYLGKIRTSAKSLLGIINDVMDFSKLEANTLKLSLAAFNINDVMARVLDQFAEAASAKGVGFRGIVSDEVPSALIGDHLRLSQILNHLADNAVKFTPKGEVEIRVDLLEKTTDDAKLLFTVKDAGIGMSDQQLAMVFDIFSQADGTFSRQYGGMGIGLSICKRLAALMGGKLSAASEPGRGSVFSLSLDFGLQKASANGLSVQGSRFKDKKVLVVDDEKTSRTLLCDHLRSFSLRTVDLDSGKAALAEMEKNDKSSPYDLMVIDWIMPDMDGLETVKKMRGLGLCNPPQVIMISAFNQDGAIRQAEKEGISTFLLKPVNASILFDAIVDALGKTEQGAAKDGETNDSGSQNRLMGAEILLVEDNAINQQIAVETLEAWGISVRIAGNGQEALDVLPSKPFDAVLMDVQMPVMDGLEATRRIRAIPENSDLPIIALTAHALEEDRIECLEAGMNDYLTKPIDPELLYSILSQWIQPQAAALPLRQPEKQDEKIVVPETGLAYLDVQAAMKILSGNRELFINVLREFCGNYAAYPGEIRSALGHNDPDTARRLAHTVKGVAGNIAAARLADVAKELELAIKHGVVSRINSLLPGFDDALDKTLSEAQRILDDNSGTEKRDKKKILNILLVDDARINRKVFYDILNRSGHVVVLAENGKDACDMVLSHDTARLFDLILMDVEMPVMDGLKATRTIRDGLKNAQEGLTRPDVPIIALTSHQITEENRKTFLEAGMNDAFTKSFDGHELLNGIDAFFREEDPECGTRTEGIKDGKIEEIQEPDIGKLQPAMQELATFLKKRSLSAETSFAALLQLWPEACLDPDIPGIRDRIDGIDYPGALKALEKMAERLNVTIYGGVR